MIPTPVNNINIGLLVLTIFCTIALVSVATYYNVRLLRQRRDLISTFSRLNDTRDALMNLRESLVEERIEKEKYMSDLTITNNHTLESMITVKPEEADYDTFVKVLTEAIKSDFKNYKFLRQDPVPEDKTSGNCIIFNIFRDTHLEEFNYLFKLAVDRGLKDIDIIKHFQDAVAEGSVIPLGNAVVIKEETGVSSVLQGDSIRVMITYMTPEYAKAREEYIDSLREDAKVEQEKKVEAREEAERLYQIRVNAIKELEEATNVLKAMREKAVKDFSLADSIEALSDKLKEVEGKVG